MMPTELVRTDVRYPLASVDHSSGFIPAPEGMALAEALALLPVTSDFGLNPDFRKHGRYWLFAQVENRTANSDWVLHISNFGFRQPAVLVKDAEGQRVISFRNDGAPGDADINTIGKGINLQLKPGQSCLLVVELKATHAAWHPYIALMSAGEYQTWTTYMDFAFKTAIGVILGLILLGIICWLLTKESAFFWASASSLLLLIYYLEHSGIPAIFWQWDYERAELFWLLVAASIFSQLAFAASFLNIRRQSGFWFYAFAGTALMTLILGLGSTQLPFRLNMLLFAINYLVVAIVILGSGIARVRAEGSYYVIYILGWLPMVLSMLEVAAVTQGAQDAPRVVHASYKMILVLYIQIAHMYLHAVALILRIRALREQKLKAEFISDSKSRFIAQSSHDLSQPLNSMKLFLEHLQPYIHEPAGEKIFHRLKQTHRQMSESFCAMMDLSRLESGCVQPDVKPVLLSERFLRLQPEYRMLANDKGIQLSFRAGSLQVMSDPVLLERMLRNLISNAIKYTDKGKVLVGCRRRGKQVAIEVFDTGCGIEAGARTHIFDIYQRAANATDQKEGSGIGLSIVRHISDLLNHPVTLTSMPGQGSRFTILLPRVFADGARAAHPVEPEPSVLLVLRNATLMEEMTERLTRWHCAVEAADSLPVASRCSDHPSVLICDYSSLQESTLSAADLDYPGRNIVTACICEPGTRLPEQWVALSANALPSQTRALLNVAARRRQSGSGRQGTAPA